MIYMVSGGCISVVFHVPRVVAVAGFVVEQRELVRMQV
jgi:hypothetical protein